MVWRRGQWIGVEEGAVDWCGGGGSGLVWRRRQWIGVEEEGSGLVWRRGAVDWCGGGGSGFYKGMGGVEELR